ncbi:hypothetical protein UFOVP1028_24 [uncultured Caudovirales phage]|uniref:Uncharacterized protein n=1 Tax=uncultured Caudovirales phage TaxID=2100421 RepID=A0A6J5PYJ6_9CAUD|nr:hypothetical protein UFOVP960_35 [uncultured Caudovirales phage]CAB4178984.1 hypothetical protein UFOVP1028_24 [uncultured Caudovirales phage]CAB4189458.1 hypothetical protein UFOVP1187_41 [uncultured Caudovirales phage]CAB4192149.1 hypothetical protein UFOVP1235_12 [uncultured Caudovirales phage]CAB4215956.1 hypothetical protein UFOVP1488_41 [uncultured Caudovirales phage]
MKEALRLFLRDSIEAGITLVVALQFTMPGDLADAKRQALIILTAVGASTWAVFRRVMLPAILQWIYPKGA